MNALLAARRKLNAVSWSLRLAGAALLVAGVTLLAVLESSALAAAVGLMAAGAALAWGGALVRTRLEMHPTPGTRRALKLLLTGSAGRLGALPLVALGGGWVAWGGPNMVLAAALAVGGLVVYAVGLVATVNGRSRLEPPGVPA